MNKFNWKWEEINEWLPIQDAALSSYLSQKGSEVLEIGTWKGGWAISMAENDRSKKICCVDPYPNLVNVREQFLRTVDLRAKNQIKLFSNFEELKKAEFREFHVIHVDGEHTQEAVERDLQQCIPLLAKNGLLIIDDIFYHSFPGVTAAAFSALSNSELSPFMFTNKKLYVCHNSNYEEFYKRAKETLVNLSIDFEEDQRITHEESSYMQSNSLNGFSLLITTDEGRVPRKFLRAIGVSRKIDFKVIGKAVLPPALLVAYKQTRKFLKG
jgi:SAM-dependent methyltransferase